MGQTDPPDSIRTLFKTISEIMGYPAVLVSYLLAISGLLGGPAPVTTAIATILVTTLYVVGWRWGAILRQKEKPAQDNWIVLPASVKTVNEPAVRRFFDPIQSHSRKNYALSLPRRRLESGLLACIFLLSTFLIASKFRSALKEFDPLLTCSSDIQQPHRILITNFQEKGATTKLNLEDRLFNFLAEHHAEGQFEVCRWDKEVKWYIEAKELAHVHTADMVIWGFSGEVYEVHLEVPAWENLNRTPIQASWQEASTADFVINETPHLVYVTEFALSEMVYLKGDVEKARGRLESALKAANDMSFAAEYPKDIAQGYFLLGLMYDPNSSAGYADSLKAIDNYKKAIDRQDDLYAAVLNRGLLLKGQGRTQEAFADFTLLIERKTPLLGSAYINRASLQSDLKAEESDLNQAIMLTEGIDKAEAYSFRGWMRLGKNQYQSAIDDLQQAIHLDSTEFFYFHMLGEAQLLSGQYDAARTTYQQIVPLLNVETRKVVLDQLDEMANKEPKPGLATVIGEIIQKLKSIQLPDQTP